MLNYKNFNQLNENAIDGMVSNIVEEKLLEFLTNRNEDVFLELKEDVNGILMTDEDGNFEYIDEEEYVTLMEHFNVIDEDEGWCVGTVDPIALSGIYENEEISDLKECALHIFLDERILESFIDDVYARVDEVAPLAAGSAISAASSAVSVIKKIGTKGMDMLDDYEKSIPKEGKQKNSQEDLDEVSLSLLAKIGSNVAKRGKDIAKTVKNSAAAKKAIEKAGAAKKAIGKAGDTVKNSAAAKKAIEKADAAKKTIEKAQDTVKNSAIVKKAKEVGNKGSEFLNKHKSTIDTIDTAYTASSLAASIAASRKDNDNDDED